MSTGLHILGFAMGAVPAGSCGNWNWLSWGRPQTQGAFARLQVFYSAFASSNHWADYTLPLFCLRESLLETPWAAECTARAQTDTKCMPL